MRQELEDLSVSSPVFMLVDDDPLIVHALSKALRPLGKVVFSTEFNQVHLMAAIAQPRILLIDIDLPEVTGLEIVRRIRSNSELDHIHVFLMTAHRSASVLNQVEGLNIDGLLIKPIDMVALLSSMGRLLGTHLGPG